MNSSPEGFGENAGLWCNPDSIEPGAPHEAANNAASECMSECLTVLVFTSPILSDPSTSLLETTTASLSLAEGLRSCRTIIVCDGWRSKADVDFLPHSGTVNNERSSAYSERIGHVQQAIREAPSWAEPHWEILRLAEWSGYGQALKAGLQQVRTPLVLVVQHDYVFTQPVPLGNLVQLFDCPDLDHSLNYIGLCKSKQVNYKENIKRRCGLDLKYVSLPTTGGQTPIELLELPQLYDSTHLAKTDWYLGLYEQTYMHGDPGASKAKQGTVGIPRGYFPEDVLSCHMLRQARETSLEAVMQTFGTYLWQQQGAVIHHTNGRQFLTGEQKEAIKCKRASEQEEKHDRALR